MKQSFNPIGFLSQCWSRMMTIQGGQNVNIQTKDLSGYWPRVIGNVIPINHRSNVCVCVCSVHAGSLAKVDLLDFGSAFEGSTCKRDAVMTSSWKSSLKPTGQTRQRVRIWIQSNSRSHTSRSETGTGTGAYAKRSRDSDLRPPDQDYFCSNPHPDGVNGLGFRSTNLSVLTHFHKEVQRARPNQQARQVMTQKHPIISLILDTSNTEHAGSTNFHEATQMGKPSNGWGWSRTKRALVS